jgi:hypothetical protein
MTATEFQIAPALQPLHAGGVHICLADDAVYREPVSQREFPVKQGKNREFDNVDLLSWVIGLQKLRSYARLRDNSLFKSNREFYQGNRESYPPNREFGISRRDNLSLSMFGPVAH